MASRVVTPPSAREINTPSAPKHGFEDSWVPYATRKSSRVSSQRAQQAAKTPSPQSPTQSLRERQVSPSLALGRRVSAGFTVNIESPGITVAKRRTIRSSLAGDTRRASGAMSEKGTALAATATGTSPAKGDIEAISKSTTTSLHKSGMLPTPVKTPKKHPEKPADPGLVAISRTLFNVRPQNADDGFPTPKKGRGKYTDLLLDSKTQEEDFPIKIHVDSRERVPELDLSADVALLRQPGRALNPAKRSTKKVKVNIPGEGEVALDEAGRREDGIIYTFRGKHLFRKFTDADDDIEPEGDMLGETLGAELDDTVPSRLRGPLTRSSLKPRLLFPTEEQLAVREKNQSQIVSEEEAVTDIEERASEVSTPREQMDDFIITPKAPRFAPVSPPTTARATRSTKKLEEYTAADSDMPFGGDAAGDERPIKSLRGGSLSPFDAWQRTKALSGSLGHGKKRQGDDIKRGGSEASKRHRSGGRAQAT